jgi:hypothetical protein
MLRKLRKLAGHGRFGVEYLLCSLRSTIVLSAGMPRSGSTWLYNAARLLLRAKEGSRLGCGWIGDWQSMPRKSVMLLKCHDYQWLLTQRAAIVLYSFRDVRDALASNKRKFATEPTLDLTRTWLDHDRRWRKSADHVLRYETMLGNPEAALKNLAQVLEVADAPIAELAQELKGLHARVGARKFDYHPENLLHPEHVTDGRPLSWHGWLTSDLVRRLEMEFPEWFVANGYPLVTRRSSVHQSRAA